MRIKLAVITAVLALAWVTPAAYGAQAPAVTPDVQTAGLLCDNNGAGACQMPAHGNDSIGVFMVTVADGNDTWRLKITHVGKVGSHTFKHRAFDRLLKGHNIDHISFHANGHNCLGVTTSRGHLIVAIEPCSGGFGVNWVYQAGALFSIVETNATSRGKTLMSQDACVNTAGCHIFVKASQPQDQAQHWSFINPFATRLSAKIRAVDHTWCVQNSGNWCMQTASFRHAYGTRLTVAVGTIEEQSVKGRVGPRGPFTNPTVSAEFRGSKIITIPMVLGSGSGRCAGQSGGKGKVVRCSSGSGRVWVEYRVTGGVNLVNVQATNSTSHGAFPQAMTAGSHRNDRVTTRQWTQSSDQTWHLDPFASAVQSG